MQELAARSQRQVAVDVGDVEVQVVVGPPPLVVRVQESLLAAHVNVFETVHRAHLDRVQVDVPPTVVALGESRGVHRQRIALDGILGTREGQPGHRQVRRGRGDFRVRDQVAQIHHVEVGPLPREVTRPDVDRVAGVVEVREEDPLTVLRDIRLDHRPAIELAHRRVDQGQLLARLGVGHLDALVLREREELLDLSLPGHHPQLVVGRTVLIRVVRVHARAGGPHHVGSDLIEPRWHGDGLRRVPDLAAHVSLDDLGGDEDHLVGQLHVGTHTSGSPRVPDLGFPGAGEGQREAGGQQEPGSPRARARQARRRTT